MAEKERWNERYASAELIWSARPNQLFETVTRDLKPGTALDLACGEGRNGIYLAEHGWHVTALDFSDVAVAKGRKIAERRGVTLDWIVADLVGADLPIAAFDLVAVIFVHSPVEERARWLPQAIDAVKPGGTFVYIGHDPRNVDEGVGGPRDKALLPSAEMIVTYLDGFSVTRAEVVSRSIASDPGHVSAAGSVAGDALDTLVCARRR